MWAEMAEQLVEQFRTAVDDLGMGRVAGHRVDEAEQLDDTAHRIEPTRLGGDHRQQIESNLPGEVARLTAFNSRRTPEVNAKVGVVAADATVDPATRESYYLARIRIPSDELSRLKEPLLPGMPVEAYVTTSERTALDYLLKPLTDQFARALREE